MHDESMCTGYVLKNYSTTSVTFYLLSASLFLK
jgi:hypothetical protein